MVTTVNLLFYGSQLNSWADAKYLYESALIHLC
jgi:hypothetical protein